jgi:ribonuclease HII
MGSVIGVDEAGRGPVIGPLVVAAVKLGSKNDSQKLVDWGVRDSKKITPTRRQKLRLEICKHFKFTIRIVTAHEIDELRKSQTLNKLEGELFGDVINTLSPDDDSTIYVDSADANEKTFKGYIESRLATRCTVISKHKADDLYPVVAAASIVAKTERDFLVKKIATELGTELGSGYPSDPITIKFLEKWIKEKGDLPPHTRHSWKTAQRLLNAVRKPHKTLDQYFE